MGFGDSDIRDLVSEFGAWELCRKASSFCLVAREGCCGAGWCPH